MFQPYQGTFHYEWYPKAASQVLTEGAVVDVINGYVTVCDITRKSHSGVCGKTVTAADSDYTATTLIPIIVPDSPTSTWKATVLSTDTATAAMVGNFYDLGGTPVGNDVTIAASDDDAVLIRKFLTANSVVVELNCLKAMKNGIGTEV